LSTRYKIISKEGQDQDLFFFTRSDKGRRKTFHVHVDHSKFYVDVREQEVIDNFDEEARRMVKSIYPGLTSLYGKPTTCIETYHTNAVGILRNLFKRSYNDAIQRKHLYMLERGLFTTFHVKGARIEPVENFNVPMRKVYWDTEWAGEECCTIAWHDPRQSPAGCVVQSDPSGKKKGSELRVRDGLWYWLKWVATEEEVLETWRDYWIFSGLPDICMGYNCSKFDWVWYFRRCEELEVDISGMSPVRRVGLRRNQYPEIWGANLFDFAPAYKQLISTSEGELESWKLKAVRKEELGESRPDYGPKVEDMFTRGSENDLEELAFYCYEDAHDLHLIDQKRGVSDGYWAVVELTGCDMHETIWKQRPWLLLLARIGLKRGICLPMRKRAKSPGVKYKGADVFEPLVGVQKNVAVLDLKSFYAAMIRSCNMSPEMRSERGDIQLPTGGRYRSDQKGILVEAMEWVDGKRDEIRAKAAEYPEGSADFKYYDILQKWAKRFNMSGYGVFGDESFPLHDKDFAMDITRSCAWVLRAIKKYCEELA
jgi:DNA polymerase elongation subunit (family B)